MTHKAFRIAFLFIILGAATFFAFGKKENALALDDNITLTTSVQPTLAMSLSSNTYAFGALTAGTPLKGPSGINIDVTTNAGNGYTLGISDSVSGSDSALLHTDTTTRIADAVATIDSPALWVSGTTKGLGVTLFSAGTTKEAKWGSGTTYNDSNNKYAGVPQAATSFHTSTGYKLGADTSSVAFIVDVPPDQKPGDYSGNATITATAVLN